MSDDAGDHEDEYNKDEHDEEGGDDGATSALAEAMELHADGHPIGAPIARVRHIHNGRRDGARRHQQHYHHHVAYEQLQPHARCLTRTDDAHHGEGQRHH